MGGGGGRKVPPKSIMYYLNGPLYFFVVFLRTGGPQCVLFLQFIAALLPQYYMYYLDVSPHITMELEAGYAIGCSGGTQQGQSTT